MTSLIGRGGWHAHLLVADKQRSELPVSFVITSPGFENRPTYDDNVDDYDEVRDGDDGEDDDNYKLFVSKRIKTDNHDDDEEEENDDGEKIQKQ